MNDETEPEYPYIDEHEYNCEYVMKAKERTNDVQTEAYPRSSGLADK